MNEPACSKSSILDVNDDEISLLLVGDRSERERGFELLYSKYRKFVLWRLLKAFPGLRPEQRQTAFHDTLVAISKMVRMGRFDLDRPLLPLIGEIARRKAIDIVRQHSRMHEVTSGRSRESGEEVSLFDLTSEAGKSLSGTKIGQSWSNLDAIERAELMNIIRDASAKLPPRQRQVMEVIIDGFPDMLDLETLRVRVSALAGEPVTYVSVKRARQEAYAKLRTGLQSEGMPLMGVNDDT